MRPSFLRQAWPRTTTWWLGAAAAAAVAVLVLSGLSGREAAADFPAARQVELQQLFDRCALDMVRGTCRVMNMAAPAATTPRLFVAGVGEVDAGAYAELRQQGNAMCETVRSKCAQAWNGPACTVSRALYLPTPAGSP